MSIYSRLGYVKDLAEFPAFRTAVTTFTWAPASVAFVFCLLDLLNLRLGFTSLRRLWEVLLNAWVVWPSWWCLVRLWAPQSIVVLSRRLVTLVWLVYLSTAAPPVTESSRALEAPQCTRPVAARVEQPKQQQAAAAAPEAAPAPELPPLPPASPSSTATDDSSKVAAKVVSSRAAARRKWTQEAHPELPEPRKDALRELFCLFDQDGSGHLTRSDFLQIGKALKGLRWTEAVARHHSERFTEINVSGTGFLSEAEFLQFFTNAGMGGISDVVFESYIHEYHEVTVRTLHTLEAYSAAGCSARVSSQTPCQK